MLGRAGRGKLGNEIKLIFTPLYASERGCDCVLNNVYVCM